MYIPHIFHTYLMSVDPKCQFGMRHKERKREREREGKGPFDLERT